MEQRQRTQIAAVLVLIGAGAVSYGCWRLLPALGYIVAGIMILLGIIQWESGR